MLNTCIIFTLLVIIIVVLAFVVDGLFSLLRDVIDRNVAQQERIERLIHAKCELEKDLLYADWKFERAMDTIESLRETVEHATTEPLTSYDTMAVEEIGVEYHEIAYCKYCHEMHEVAVACFPF